MKTMSEVLAAHPKTVTEYASGLIYCANLTCRAYIGTAMELTGSRLESAFAAHQSAALTAAGFGLVADAKREALEEAAADWWLRDDVRDRFGAWSWLRDRAAAVRGEG